MTEKELKKLNRYQLLEIIVMQKEEIEKLTAEVKRTNDLLKNQQIKLARAGNIAQASLMLSGVFEAAQEAADIYLDSVKEYTDKGDAIIAAAKVEARKILNAAKRRATQIENGQLSNNAK